ncbi:MAG: site-specific DNA-methyltransferase [Propionibacteriales bacterium]|nr:site-specific DNA-methyltransferase [Propionibacteriales bacterium]
MTRHLPRNQILTGDATERLADLPDHSIDSLVTSPPYFRLRDYQATGQLGLESHIDDWVSHLRAVLQEAARVLVPTGTVWLNLGDSFSTHKREGATRKSLLFGPERLALALIEDGWTIRNKVVWAKTTTVPSSVTDRLSTRYELVYLLVRSRTYYFDLDSIREPHTSRVPKKRAITIRDERPAWLGPNSDGDSGLAKLHARGIRGHPLGKNPGDVWRLGVSGFRGAHFATFPESLARRMVEAGTPRIRCSQCRAPWTRKLIRTGDAAERAPPRPTCDHESAEPGIVLDPFIGSGTTAIAASKLGRDWLGIELNPDFVELANERIEQAVRHPSTSNRKEVS